MSGPLHLSAAGQIEVRNVTFQVRFVFAARPELEPLVIGQHMKREVTVLRTVRVSDERDLVELERLKCDAVHFDAYVPGQLGGTGVMAPWDLIEAHRPDVPFVLSGGLKASNVADAIQRLRPAGVDVSSGVEREPGIKDAEAMRAFVDAARGA